MLKNKKGEWDWQKITISIFVVLVVPLIGLVYNNMADTIKAVEVKAISHIKRVESNVNTKVSEKSLMQYIAIQQQQTDMLKEDLTEQKIIDKETLKTLQNLNINIKLVEHQLKTQ